MLPKLTAEELASFKKFDLHLKKLVYDFISGSNYVGSDYSYYAFMSWFDDGEYLIKGDVIYLRCHMDEEEYYWPPLINAKSVITQEEAARALLDGTQFAFCTEDFINAMYGGYCVYTHRDWAEYIYDASDFINLPGKRYHAKRNHIAKFKKLYNYEISPLKESDINEIKAFELEWLESKKYDAAALRSAEREGEMVEWWLKSALDGDLICDVLRVDGRLVGIGIGEILPSGTGIALYEKANTNYDGVYAFLANEFASRNFSKCRYINRQEDMGIEGLRKSKLSYNPAFLLQKYVLKPAVSVSECYAERTGRLLSKDLEIVKMSEDSYVIKKLSESDYDMVMSFLERERNALKNKLFFLNYTEAELMEVLSVSGMYGAFVGEDLIATCAYDTDPEYAAHLAKICGAEGDYYYEFSGIMTAAAYRGKGVSGKLCAFVIDRAAEALLDATLCAVVQFDNVPSLNNLKKLGFTAKVTKPYKEYTFTYLTREIKKG